MTYPDPIRISVDDQSQVGEARRTAATLANRLGFDETEAGKVAIVATELAQNIIRHATRGEVILKSHLCGNVAGLEILALDRGPGIADLGRSLRDGFSTAGTAGNGLGAIKRLSSYFDLYSSSGAGTAVLSQLWARPLLVSRARAEVCGVICLPHPAETECGDSWEVSRTSHRIRLLITDGLGHGPEAARASREICLLFRANTTLSLPDLTKLCHDSIRHTRGAVMGMAEVDFLERTVRFVGVGNIAGCIIAPQASSGMASYGGTVGYSVPRIQEFVYPWPANALLVLHSDGLATRWDLKAYPGLTEKHPSLIAAVLYRDFTRGNDDVTVLVMREGAADGQRTVHSDD